MRLSSKSSLRYGESSLGQFDVAGAHMHQPEAMFEMGECLATRNGGGSLETGERLRIVALEGVQIS